MQSKDKEKPGNKLNMSRQEYFTAHPWKKSGMKRKQFEEILLLMPDGFVEECKAEAETDRLVKAMFGDLGE